MPGSRDRYSRASELERFELAVREVLADFPHMAVADVAVVVDWRLSRRHLSNLVAALRPQYCDEPDVDAPLITALAVGELLEVGEMTVGEREPVSGRSPSPEELAPPEGLPAEAAVVWREIVASNDLAGTVDRAALEAFCTLMARLREARRRVDAEGMVVKDPRGRVVPHPALLVERQTAEQIRAWGDRFAPLVKPVRRRGYMADATAAAIAAAPHLGDRRYAGAVAAVKTLAWLIDEAQRAGMDQLQKATFGTIPTYLKACDQLLITPSSAPAVPARGGGASGGSGGTVSSLRDAAARHRGARA